MERPAGNKPLAFMFLFFLLVLYMDSVWTPYFTGSEPGQERAQSEIVSEASETTLAPSGSSSNGQPKDVTSKEQVADFGLATEEEEPLEVTESQIDEAGSFVVESDKFIVKISKLGGRLLSVKLKEHKQTLEPESDYLEMIQHVEQMPYPAGITLGKSDDRGVLYQASSSAAQSKKLLTADSKYQLELVGQTKEGVKLTKSFSFQGDSPFIGISAKASPAHKIALELIRPASGGSASMFNPRPGDTYVYFDGDKATRAELVTLEPDIPQKFDEALWLTLGDLHFMTTLLSEEARPGFVTREDGYARAVLGGNSASLEARLYAGPKQYDYLESFELELERNVNLGYTGFIAAPLLWLMHVFYDFFGNYGVSIVLLTILIKAVLFPLNTASFKQMKAMQDLQPEMAKIKEQTKDKAEQQQKMMALYKKKGVNPMGSCFPMFLQLPIFFGLFTALRLAVELRHAPFAFWITDLSGPESLEVAGVGVPVMVVLFVLSMMAQQWTMPSNMDKVQKRVMMFMPIMMGFFFANFPAGLSLYWLTNNIISIAQQRALHNHSPKYAIKLTAIVSLVVFLLALFLAYLGT